ncbi:alpha/beta fold hydrolase [Brevibacillus fluminis]|uniref:alpha/beta fold hydrolase n=1 Tax=Brevibacillus fluminis TaxID=511487 RepID=UPI003F89D10B
MKRIVRQFTTADGFKMEYSIVGQGEPILVMHGGHSNCHEEFGYQELVSNGYSIITPSRPGYGKTAKELGITVETACAAYAQLLDDLQIAQVHLLAISAGGPSGIHFASRFPQRVKSLALQSAVAGQWLTPADKAYKAARLLFQPRTEACVWGMMRLVNKLSPRFLLKSMFPSFSTRPAGEQMKLFNENDLERFRRMVNRQRSGHGFLLDLAQSGGDLTSVLAAVRCPTLIMHSVHDASVPVEHARHAHRHIPGAQLCELDSWGHLIWLGKGAADVSQKLLAFLDAAGGE